MALSKFNENVNIIQGLADQPLESATQLKQAFDEASNLIKTYLNSTLTSELDTALSGKVDKVEGKGLSEEDFTSALKTKLDGIAEQATRVIIEDVLTSDSAVNGLSAKQGKALKSLVDGKAPTSHASSGTTYGVGTGSNYGHCKSVNNLTTASYSNGECLSAYQGKVLKSQIDGKAPTNHKSTTDAYGLGGGDYYGHVKLINNLTSSTYKAGEALSAKQGYELNQKITPLQAHVDNLEARVTALENR